VSGKGFTVKKAWEEPVERTGSMPVPAEMKIGPVEVRPATVLAPMAGVTDTIFRRFIRHASFFTTPVPSLGSSTMTGAPGLDSETCDSNAANVESAVSNTQSGCGLLMTEFTSADGLSRMRESKRKRYLTFFDDEHPISAQLFGSNPQTLAEAARICQDTGFDIVDLNLGCPAKRVVGCNGGSGLLRDLPKIGEIFRAVRKSVSIPFTVKFRLGWNDENIICVELAKMAESEGLNALALHARTREQSYTGYARWEWIAAVKQAVKIPVIGNGDIRTPEDAAAMVAKTGCDGVMIGRGAPANPWIFRQIAQFTATGRYDKPTSADRHHMIRAYFEMLMSGGETGSIAEKPENSIREAAGKMKQFTAWFTHGVPNGAKLRAAIYQAKSSAAILDQVDAFFEAQAAASTSAKEPTDAHAPLDFSDAALVCD
jgi:tRNA-dihydrouridine synthase B